MVQTNRSLALIDLAKIGDAIRDSETAINTYTRLVETDGQEIFVGDLVAALDGLAWLYATYPDEKFRNGTKAVEYAGRSCKLTGWTDFKLLDTLAAAYAELGEFDVAVQWEVTALDLAPEDAKKDIGARLQLFRTKKQYREKRSS